MKKYYIFILGLCFCSLFACGDGATTSSTPQPSRASEDTLVVDKPSPTVAKLLVEPLIKITPKGAADERGHYWGTALKVDLVEGFSILTPSADKGSKDWMFEAYTLEKDGKEIYSFPHKEEDMRATVINDQKDQKWYPKVLTKGDKTAIIMLRYLGEDVEKSHVVDLIKIKNGQFVTYLQDVVAYNYTEDLSLETLESIFDKTFE